MPESSTDERLNGVARHLFRHGLVNDADGHIDIPSTAAQWPDVGEGQQSTPGSLNPRRLRPASGANDPLADRPRRVLHREGEVKKTSRDVRRIDRTTSAGTTLVELATKTSPPSSTAAMALANPPSPASMHTTSTSSSQFIANYLSIARSAVHRYRPLSVPYRQSLVDTRAIRSTYSLVKRLPRKERGVRSCRSRSVATARAGIRGGLPARAMATTSTYHPRTGGGPELRPEPGHGGSRPGPASNASRTPNQESSRRTPYIPFGSYVWIRMT